MAQKEPKHDPTLLNRGAVRLLGGDGGEPLVCAKGSCQRPPGRLQGGMRLCREHAEAGLARGWREGRALWALACDHNLRDALASGDEGLTRKWSGLLEEAKARLAQAEADLAAKEEVAGLPERRGHGRTRGQEGEWEPSADLMGALEGMSLLPGETLGGDLAGMRPHLEEALGALGRLGQRRDLSKTEKMRAEALRMLLASIERARR